MLQPPFKVQTKVSWAGEEEGDLGFLENEIIEVYDIVDEAWWSGKLRRNKAEGIFPMDYVEVLEPMSHSGSNASLNQFSPKKSRAGTPNTSFVDEDYSFDASFEGKRKGRSKMVSSTNHPKYKHAIQEEREREMENFRQMKMQRSRERERAYKKERERADKEREKVKNEDACYKSPPYSPDYKEISMKRQQLEMELEHLRQLEKSTLRKSREMKEKVDYEDYRSPIDHSYTSEEVLSSLGKKVERESEDECGSPPPPPPKHVPYKVPYDSDDFRVSDRQEAEFRHSQAAQEELKSSLRSLQSDVLNLSELSATSAGSFLRHKYERDMRASQERLANMSVEEDESKRSLFKRMLKKDDKKDDKDDANDDWTNLKMDVNRLNTLSSHDKQSRTRRTVREEGSLIVKPLDYISDINTNEVLGDIEEDEGEDMALPEGVRSKIDAFMQRYDVGSDLNELISDVSVKFGTSRVAQIRCILVHLCRFAVVEETGRISQTKPKLSEVCARGEATVYQINYLFRKILDALRIPSEVVLGFWKKPNEFYHNEQFVVNHCWLSVLVNKRFLIVDPYCFKNGAVCNVRTHPRGYNEHYFLTKPLKVVSTHVPSVIDLQHVLPPIDQNVAFHLPRTYSGFYNSNLRIRTFNNALTRLKDLEFFEMELEIPLDVELFALVKTAKVTSNDLCLCQVFWNNNKRLARVKALLPEGASVGVLQLFAGPKGLQKHFDNVHELAVSIPLYHTGTYRPTKFIPRFPTVSSMNNDLYVKSPQTSKIVAKNAYNFEIWQHPSRGVTSGSGLMNQDFKVVIESPSGKYFKLVKSDPRPFGVYESHLKCHEVGLYRGLVIGDSGNSWYVFTQWEAQ